MDYYKRTGIFPIMHLVAMRREYHEANRFAASALFQALNDSKELARKRMEFTGALRYMLPWLPQELDDIREVFGEDCWPYGDGGESEDTRGTSLVLARAGYD